MAKTVTPQQNLFCLEYVKCGKIYDAGKASGYSKRGAEALFKQRKIQDWIRQTSQLGLPEDAGSDKEWYIHKLVRVINHGIPDDDSPLELMPARLALIAGEQLCRLRGYNEPEKRLNIVAKADIAQLHQLMDKIKEKEKEY
jgi:hypothetical protein